MKNSRTTVHLRFKRFGFDPDELTATLGVRPEFVHRRGDPKQRPPVQGVPPWDSNYWSASRRVASSESVSDGIERWLAILERHRPLVRRALRSGGEGNFWVTWQGDAAATGTFNEGAVFEPALLKRIASLGLELQVETFVSSEHAVSK